MAGHTTQATAAASLFTTLALIQALTQKGLLTGDEGYAVLRQAAAMADQGGVEGVRAALKDIAPAAEL